MPKFYIALVTCNRVIKALSTFPPKNRLLRL